MHPNVIIRAVAFSATIWRKADSARLLLKIHFHTIIIIHFVNVKRNPDLRYTAPVSMNKATTILMMGKTGSGKGTQSTLLAEKLGYNVFSTGDEFRKIRKFENFLGEKVRSEYDKGLLMPHWFASYLFEDALLKTDPKTGLVCEGIGRKEPEAKLFNDVAGWLGRDYLVIELLVSDEEVIRRQLQRDRGDSLNDRAKIEVRLEEYRTYTEAAINFFKSLNKVTSVDGMGTPDAIHAEILKILNI